MCSSSFHLHRSAPQLDSFIFVVRLASRFSSTVAVCLELGDRAEAPPPLSTTNVICQLRHFGCVHYFIHYCILFISRARTCGDVCVHDTYSLPSLKTVCSRAAKHPNALFTNEPNRNSFVFHSILSGWAVFSLQRYHERIMIKESIFMLSACSERRKKIKIFYRRKL